MLNMGTFLFSLKWKTLYATKTPALATAPLFQNLGIRNNLLFCHLVLHENNIMYMDDCLYKERTHSSKAEQHTEQQSKPYHTTHQTNNLDHCWDHAHLDFNTDVQYTSRYLYMDTGSVLM